MVMASEDLETTFPLENSNWGLGDADFWPFKDVLLKSEISSTSA